MNRYLNVWKNIPQGYPFLKLLLKTWSWLTSRQYTVIYDHLYHDSTPMYEFVSLVSCDLCPVIILVIANHVDTKLMVMCEQACEL